MRGETSSRNWNKSTIQHFWNVLWNIVFCEMSLCFFVKLCFIKCVFWIYFVFCDMFCWYAVILSEMMWFCNGVVFSKMAWFLKCCVLQGDVVFYEMTPCFLKYSHVSTIRPPSDIQCITIQAAFPQTAFKVVISWTNAAELIPFLFVFI